MGGFSDCVGELFALNRSDVQFARGWLARTVSARERASTPGATTTNLADISKLWERVLISR